MLRFGSTRVRSEWYSPSCPAYLKLVACYLAGEVDRLYGHDTLLTSVFRTQEEDSLLKAKSKTHQEWRAVDLTAPLTNAAADRMVDDVNSKFPQRLVSKMPRCAPYRHGTAPHFHIQISRPEAVLSAEAQS